MLKKILIGLVALILIGFLGLWIAVKVFLPPAKVMQIVSEEGSKALGREVKVGSASVGIFPSIKVSINDVTLANHPDFSEEPLFQIKSLSLAIDFMSLVAMSPVIKEIKLVEPKILVEVDKKGRMNTDGLGGESAPDDSAAEPEETAAPDTSAAPTSLPGALALKSFKIENASLKYLDHKSGQAIVLGSINQEVSVEVDKNLENIQTIGELIVASISMEDPGAGLKKGNVRFSLNHKIGVNLPAQEISIGELKVGLQDIFISTQGQVKDFGKPAPFIDLKIKSNELKMGSLLKEVPASLNPELAKLSASGFALIDIAVKGKLDSAKQPDLKANVSFNNMAFAHSDLPAGITDLNGQLAVTNQTVDLKGFGFKLADQQVDISLSLKDAQEKSPFLNHLKLNASFDLGKFMALAEKFGVAPDSTELSGILTANIDASGKLDPEKPTGIKAAGSIILKDVNALTPGLPDRVIANGNLGVTNTTIKNVLAVKIGDSDVKLGVDIKDYLALAMPEAAGSTRTKMNIEVVSANLDLDKILPTGSGEEEEEVAEEESEPLTSYPTLPPVDMVLNVKLDRTKLLDLEMTKYRQTTTLKNSVLNSTLGGTLYTGTFSNNLMVNLQDTTNAKIAMKLKVNKVEANDFISRVNDKLPATNAIAKSFAESDSTVYGKLSMDVDVKTFGLPQDFSNNLTGDIYVGLFNGKLNNVGVISTLSDGLSKLDKRLAFKGFSFTKVDMSLEAKDGKMVVKHVDIKNSPVGTLEFGGSVGFDNILGLTMAQTLPKNQSAFLTGATSKATSKLAGVGLGDISVFPKDKQGNVMLHHLFGGTLSKPTYDGLDKEKMGSSAKDQVKDALKNKLNAEKEKVKAKLDAKKQEAQAKIDAKKQEAEAKIAAEKAKLEAEKKKAEEKAQAEKEKAKQKAEEEAKKKAKGKLKGLF